MNGRLFGRWDQNGIESNDLADGRHTEMPANTRTPLKATNVVNYPTVKQKQYVEGLLKVT